MTRVEVEAAGLAAERRRADLLAPIEVAFAVMESSAAQPVAGHDDPFLVADVAFHKAIIDATEIHMLRRLAEPLQHALLESRRPLVRPVDRLGVAIPLHQDVLDAIASGRVADARVAAGRILAIAKAYLDGLGPWVATRH